MFETEAMEMTVYIAEKLAGPEAHFGSYDWKLSHRWLRRFFGVQCITEEYCSVIENDETCYRVSTTVWLSKCSHTFTCHHVKIYLCTPKDKKMYCIFPPILAVFFVYLFVFTWEVELEIPRTSVSGREQWKLGNYSVPRIEIL